MKYSKVREKKRNKLRLKGKAFFQKAGSKLIRNVGQPMQSTGATAGNKNNKHNNNNNNNIIIIIIIIIYLHISSPYQELSNAVQLVWLHQNKTVHPSRSPCSNID